MALLQYSRKKKPHVHPDDADEVERPLLSGDGAKCKLREAHLLENQSQHCSNRSFFEQKYRQAVFLVMLVSLLSYFKLTEQ